VTGVSAVVVAAGSVLALDFLVFLVNYFYMLLSVKASVFFLFN
jgi:hypothetical protein